MSPLSEAERGILVATGWAASRIGFVEQHLALRAALPVYTIEVAQAFAAGRPDVLADVAAMLSKIDPANGDLPVLYAAAHRQRREFGLPKAGPGKGRAPRLMIPLAEVPAESRNRIEEWRGSEKVRERMLATLRRVLGAARRAGLAERLDGPALAAFRAELQERASPPATLEIYMTDCRRLGCLFKLDAALLALIANEVGGAQRAMQEQPAKRHADFRAAPLTPIDYARAAREASLQAHASTGSRQTRHRLFLTAAVLALLSWLPERISDIVTAKVGQDVIRGPDGWRSEYFSSKTHEDRGLLLPDALTPYLDDLILLGADPGPDDGVLDRLYRQRAALCSHLFARVDLERPYSATRVFEWVKQRTGHGPHAARKAMADYVAEIGAPLEDILSLLGHRTRGSAGQHYEINASRIRRGRTLERLGQARQDLVAGEAFRTPAGRLVDLDKINRKLERARGAG